MIVFHQDRKSKGGLISHCISCRKEQCNEKIVEVKKILFGQSRWEKE